MVMKTHGGSIGTWIGAEAVVVVRKNGDCTTTVDDMPDDGMLNGRRAELKAILSALQTAQTKANDLLNQIWRSPFTPARSTPMRL